MRAQFTIFGEQTRREIIGTIAQAPLGSRVQINDEQRSLEQNSKMWALLGEVSRQISHGGRRYEPDQWKALFLHALGEETEFLPSLNGKTFVPYNGRSSKLSRKEMSELIEFIIAWGTQRGVKFADELMDGGKVA